MMVDVDRGTKNPRHDKMEVKEQPKRRGGEAIGQLTHRKRKWAF